MQTSLSKQLLYEAAGKILPSFAQTWNVQRIWPRYSGKLSAHGENLA